MFGLRVKRGVFRFMAEKKYETPEQEYKARVIEDLSARSEWATKDESICKRRLGERPAKKQKPYPGAPNFVEMIIDDTTREKTDQELSMFFNAPRVCHAASLVPISSDTRSKIELGFDSYFRYLIPNVRAKVEELMDTKNCRGFAVAGLIRTRSSVIDSYIADFEWVDPLDLIVPPDTKHIQDSSTEYVCRVFRWTELEFRSRATDKEWVRPSKDDPTKTNVDMIVERTKSKNNVTPADDEKDTYEKTRHLIGLATSSTEHVVVWQLYRYATAQDVLDNPDILAEGRRICVTFSPDMPDEWLAKYPWREPDITITRQMTDQEKAKEMTLAMVQNRSPVIKEMSVTKYGADKPWPFVRFPYENRMRYWYASRGLGHLCMDEQIGATAMRNAEATMIEFYQTPTYSGNVKNSQNVTLAPGSILPEGVSPNDPPTVPQQISFNRNDFKSTAAKRAGAVGMYNYSQNVGTNRKLQKTATEVDSENTNSAQVSSASVDRFNEPMAELCQMLFDDLKRLKVTFPIISFSGETSQQFDKELYEAKIILIPAASSRTLTPDLQIQRYMQMFGFNAQFAAQTGFNFAEAMKAVNASWDARMTKGWLPDAQQMPPIMARLQQVEQDIQLLAKGGSQLSKRVESTEKLSVKTYDKIAKEKQNVVQATTLPSRT